ncbi:MAG: hypothetical protein ACREIV_01700, partial [Planctomycetaceae bacterium]
MDLPTCPACGQSVLDEDAENCPFCGASMRGKPSSAPKPKATAAPKAAAAPAPAAPTAKKTEPRPTVKRPTGEEQYIEAETPATRRVIKASPKPARGRTYRVVCPMCETQGFIPRQAAGMEVRCPNPKCLVPVFTAPPLEVDQPEPEPPKASGLSPLVLGAVGLAILGAAGFFGWYFFIRDDAPTELGPATVYQPQEAAERETADDGPVDGDNGGTEPQQPAEPELPPDEVVRRALAQMQKTARIDRTDGNRSKPYSRKLAAEAYALAGDVDGAFEQIRQLGVVRADPSDAVEPLVEIAWQQHAAGKEDEARQRIAEAQRLAEELSNYGRDRLESATSLAIALVAFGQIEPARALLEEYHDGGPAGQLSAWLHYVRDLETFDLDTALQHGPVLPWANPQWTAVTQGLVLHGFADEALKWAGAAEEPAVRTESVIAWAEALTALALRDGGTEDLSQIDSAAASMPPAEQARLFARVAGVFFAHGRNDEATAWLSKATASLQQVSAPQPASLPDLRTMYREPTIDATPLRMAAVAAAEIARVQAELGQPEPAWSSMQTALNFTRAMTPSPVVVEEHIQSVTSRRDQIQDQLRSELSLDSADEAATAYIRYRQQTERLLAAARERFDLQAALLAEAAEWGLHGPVWSEVQSRSAHADAGAREPYLKSSRVPSVLLRVVDDDEMAEQ